MALVSCVDCGTILAESDYADYSDFMASLLGASSVDVNGTATNSDGIELVFFTAKGEIEKMASNRLFIGQSTDFTIKWYDDARDQGFFAGIKDSVLDTLVSTTHITR